MKGVLEKAGESSRIEKNGKHGARSSHTIYEDFQEPYNMGLL